MERERKEKTMKGGEVRGRGQWAMQTPQRKKRRKRVRPSETKGDGREREKREKREREKRKEEKESFFLQRERRTEVVAFARRKRHAAQLVTARHLLRSSGERERESEREREKKGGKGERKKERIQW